MIDYPYMIIDVETTGLDWTTDRLHGIGIAYNDGPATYHPAWDVPDYVRRELADPGIAKVGHNLHGFDAKFVRKAGFEIRGEFDDTMVLYNLIDPDSQLGLKYLSEKFIGPESLEKKHALDEYCRVNQVQGVAGLCSKDLLDDRRPHLEIVGEYCKEDVLNTRTLFETFYKKLQEFDRILKGPKYGFKKSPLDYYLEEARPLERVLFEIEYRGIRIDTSAIERVRADAEKNMTEISARLTKIMSKRIEPVVNDLYLAAREKAKNKIVRGEGKTAFAWSNNNHVAALLYKYCDLPSELVKRTPKGKYCTDKAAILSLKDALGPKHRLTQVLDLFLEYRKHGKILTTYTGNRKKGIFSKIRYVDGIPRIFPVYRQTTGTGRLACSNPNMQNLKRESDVKRFFVPDTESEVFFDGDYSQIELRTGAHLSQDQKLLTAYRDDQDVHLMTASRLFGREITKADDVERQAGKRTNFLTIFDGKAPRLRMDLKADTGKDFTLQECKDFIKIWFNEYPEVRAYLDAQKDFFERYKFCISETGRIRRLPDIVFGSHIEWVLNDDGEGRHPMYRGNDQKRGELLKSFLAKNRHRLPHEVSPEEIGREAYRRYSHALKVGYNQPIQGLAASMAKRAMIVLYHLGYKISNQVHDSLTVSIDRKESGENVVKVMEENYRLSLPVKVDVKLLRSFHPKDKA